MFCQFASDEELFFQNKYVLNTAHVEWSNMLISNTHISRHNETQHLTYVGCSDDFLIRL